MLGESRLNVYVLGDNLSPRQREWIQAQIQAALQSVPQWTLDLVDGRIEEVRVGNLHRRSGLTPHGLDLLIETFAAYALGPSHDNWTAFPAVFAFFERWR